MIDSSLFWICLSLNTLLYHTCRGDMSLFVETKTLDSVSPCSDWTTYTDEKCIKIFDASLMNQAEAETFCHDVAKPYQSHLLTIKAPAHQQFVSLFLFENKKIVDNVWLGIRPWNPVRQDLTWVDESGIGFSNWEVKDNGPSHKSDCAQMETGYEALYSPGSWTWTPCNKSNVVVCERLQGWSLNELQQKFLQAKENFDKDIADLKNENELLKELVMSATANVLKEKEKLSQAVPVGYIYVQLSYQLPPTDLWPELVWKDVSENYAGLFFRVTGGQSGGMSKTQEENSPRLTSLKYAKGYDGNPIEVTPGTWSGRIYSGSDKGEHWGISFLVSGGEVRPRNQAVSVWKRIK